MLQALEQASVAKGRRLTMFTPALLRQALRQAGQVVRRREIDEVLAYVISDRRYSDLDQLWLVLLCNNTVAQLRCGPTVSAEHQDGEEEFFLWTDIYTRKMYDLMPNSEHRKVQDCEAWRQIAR